MTRIGQRPVVPTASPRRGVSRGSDAGIGRSTWRRIATVLALAGIAHAAQAGLFDDEEARKRIEATSQRLTQLQQQLDERITALELKSKGIVDLNRDLELLKADVARIRGQIEVLLFEQEQQQKRQRDLYVDLDGRLRKLETSAAAAAVAPAPEASPAVAAVPPAATEQRTYDAALEQFKRADYAGAVTGFGAFVKAYPQSALTPSAQYWIGNAQFARKDFRAAIAAQRTLLTQYPDSAKVPDALLNIGSAQSELGDNAAARKTLEELIAKHPQSEAAAKAKQRLGMR